MQVKNFIEIALSRSDFRDKQVFAFKAEIQDGHQKWAGKGFLQKVASRLCRYPVGQKIESKSLYLALVLVWNKNIYTDIKPYFALRIDRY